LDGSEPTVKSNIANISYPYFQPDLNAPITINSDVTIKTRTIGIGHYDSDIVTYYYKVGRLAFTIKGAGFETEKSYAVEALKEMTPVQQTYKISENGSLIDLNGKGVLLSTFFDNLSISNTWRVKFIDSSGTEYDAGTVQNIKDQKCMLAYQVNGSDVTDVLGDNNTYIQILRNYNTGTNSDNRLKNIQTIKLVNVDDKVNINSVKLLDNTDKVVSSIASGGGYRIQANLVNKTGAKIDGLLIIKVRNGSGATNLEGGNTIGYAAIRSVIPISGNIATAEFTMPSGLSGKAYVDVYVWDNYTDHISLGADHHDLSFDIK